MQVALVSETWFPQINGVSRSLERLAWHLTACGDRVHLLIPRYASPAALPAGLTAQTFSAVGLPGYREVLLPFVAPARLRRDLAALAPDLVHIATEGPLGWAALRAARSLGLPVVSSYHTNFAQYLSSYRLGVLTSTAWRYLAWFHNQTRLTFCPTPSVASLLEERGFANLRIWSRGVDSDLFHPRRRDLELRRQLGIPDRTVALLYTGRLAPEKNLPMLLDAFRRLQGEVRLILVGDGPLRSQIDQAGISGLICTGYRQGEELARLYAAADIFAFPSTSETFGNVLLEAMASGVPPVGFAVPGPQDLIRHRENGLLVTEVAPGSLAAALQELVDGAERRHQLGTAARSYAESQNWHEINAAVRRQYQTLIGDDSPLAALGSAPAVR